MIYLKGKHGTRLAENEDEAKQHERDGYVRYDPRVEMDAKRKAMAEEVKEVKPKRGRPKK